MAESSFDMVSQINMQELTNAVDQTKREIANRFDFKGTKVSIELGKEELTLVADDEGKMNQLKDVFHSKLFKRGIALKAVKYGTPEQASGGLVREKATFVNGIPKDICKDINKMIKDSKLKVKAQTLDEKIRVSGKSKDDLQKVMALVKEKDLEVPIQFNNYK